MILESYLEWGSDCVERFEGMFAFVIIDEDNQTLVMCRDRFGTKPLYYYCDDKSLIFASEVQCIRTFINLSVCNTSVQQFLKFGYILQPNSIFENVFQVDAGTYLMFDLKTLEFQTCRYWSIEDYYNEPRRKSLFYSDIYLFEKILRDAVQSRLIADVPVGICLSGGYDSSVTALLASLSSDEKLKTFTIGFDDPARDERDIAREFAQNLGTEHHELVSDQEDIADILNTIIKNSGEPISDSSIIPTFILFKLIAKHSKAALSADGGDELFAGYNIYVKSLFIRQLNYFFSYPMEFFLKFPLPTSLRKIFEKVLRYRTLTTGSEFINSERTIFTEDDIGKLMDLVEADALNPKVTTSLPFLEQMQLHDAKHYQQSSILVKVDRMSMFHSVEAREPFLNKELQEFGISLHRWRKLNMLGRKRPLRRFVTQHLQSNVLKRPKRGFGSPIDKWLSSKFKDHFLKIMRDKRISEALNINHDAMYKIALNSTKNYAAARKAWVAYMLYYWAKQNLIDCSDLSFE